MTIRVRTRIAPSPTGDPHVGTAYIALFNLCFARRQNGEFILRIEDTDQMRSTTKYEQAIFDSLRWLGLQWAEGPDIGGDFGPYRQSERVHIYQHYAQQLVDSGDAFYCYRTEEELENLRKKCRKKGKFTALKPSDFKLPDKEIAKRRAAGMPFVVRMNVPEESGVCSINDILRGTIKLNWEQIDAQILLKSDGMPTYHLANVVDDHLMKITHVIRGEEWINSAPKHQLLYAYFGWDMPTLCHLPLLRNPDKSKLSKRKNPTSILYYRKMGYLPEGLLNYLGSIGWSMPDGREKFTLNQMIDFFDIRRVTLGGPIFDVEKLSWMNGLWIREQLDITELSERLHDWSLNMDTIRAVLPYTQDRMKILSDFIPLAGFLFSGMLKVEKEKYTALSLTNKELKEILQFTIWQLEALQDWKRETIFRSLKYIADAMDIELKDFFAPLFIAISGSLSSFSVIDAILLLGSEMSRARLSYTLLTLYGEMGKKQIKKLEEHYYTYTR